MKDVGAIYGGEPIRRPQDGKIAENQAGALQPNSVNGYAVNNRGMGTTVQNTAYNPFNTEITDEKYQKAFGKTTGLQATKKARNAQTELFEKYNEVRTKLTRLSKDSSQPPEVRLSAQNCLAELEALQFRQLPEPAEKGNKQVRLMAFTDAVEDDYQKPNQKMMDDLINDYDLTTVLSQMKRHAAQINATTVGVGSAVMANDDANTALLAKQIDDGTAEVLHQIKVSEGNVTRQVIRTGNKVIGVVRDATGKILERIDDTQQLVEKWGITNAQLTQFYGEANLAETHYHGVKNNKEIKHQGEQTRETVENTSQQTQELNGISDKITTTLSHATANWHTEKTVERINNMRNKILQSDAPFEKKKEALTHLAAFSTQTVMNDTELAQEEMKIQGMLNPSEARPRMDRSITKGATGTVIDGDDPYHNAPIPDVPQFAPYGSTPKSGKTPDVEPNKPLPKDEPKADGHGGPLDKPNEDKPDGGEPATPPSLKKPEEEKLPKPEWQK